MYIFATKMILFKSIGPFTLISSHIYVGLSFIPIYYVIDILSTCICRSVFKGKVSLQLFQLQFWSALDFI